MYRKEAKRYRATQDGTNNCVKILDVHESALEGSKRGQNCVIFNRLWIK